MNQTKAVDYYTNLDTQQHAMMTMVYYENVDDRDVVMMTKILIHK